MTALTDTQSRPQPVFEAGTPDDISRRAWWDVVEGLRLWPIWAQQSHQEVRRRYKRTMLGPAWVSVSLLIFALSMSLVWSNLWHTSAAKFLPFLLSGLLPWTLISSAIGEGCGVFLSGESLVKSRNFPYSVLIYSALARNVVVFGHNLIAYAIVALVCGVRPHAATLLLVPGLLLVVLNCTWMCVVVAVCCLRYRDFPQIVTSLLQLASFVTPIFWSADQLSPSHAAIFQVNLLHHMVDIIRQPLLGRAPAWQSYALSTCGLVLGGILAYRLFAAKRHRFAYWF